jgi:hypothetical protein
MINESGPRIQLETNDEGNDIKERPQICRDLLNREFDRHWRLLGWSPFDQLKPEGNIHCLPTVEDGKQAMGRLCDRPGETSPFGESGNSEN